MDDFDPGDLGGMMDDYYGMDDDYGGGYGMDDYGMGGAAMRGAEEIKTEEEWQKYLEEHNEASPCVMAYIPEDDEKSLEGYKEAADAMGDTFFYGYSSNAELFGRKLTSSSVFVYK